MCGCMGIWVGVGVYGLCSVSLHGLNINVGPSVT